MRRYIIQHIQYLIFQYFYFLRRDRYKMSTIFKIIGFEKRRTCPDGDYNYTPAASLEGDDDDGDYDYAPMASLEGDDDDGDYDYVPAA
ncbi:hypothetical protein MTR67_053322 [Solanum verrucosum]|uniref:Uncharacterized protein n=1 Tax=Solanum verrucosum TaxID=315347 RepID=A0AAF0V8N3_SOLVR|nr:hypothetical protein MTR67_053322 [Solanum verrucosum]